LIYSNKQKGNEGEEIAAKFLQEKGWKIIVRNYRYGKGEIDIVAEDGECLVFVEVKFRKSLEKGPPENAFTKNKIKQVKKIAELYLYQNEIKDKLCRIDAIAILKESGKAAEIKHYKNISEL